MSDKTQMDRMEDLLTQLIGNVASNRSDLVGLKNDMAGFREDMDAIRSDVASFRSDMDAIRSDMASFRSEVNERLDRIEGQQALTDKRLSVQRDDIANLRERVGVIEQSQH
ncbi:hypothetical protein [Alicyclobacillus sp. SO9]|uniref:hypothetical protein n=1 Tax=Alicyclobacillus sp. SO9 TaxID=2665646 RepID=UPI0018E866F8|nr:hypothetical protein [Alicyclobacillus sp. SO9]QQE80020.1 hypothetical protein GI364_05985 [Alicyclobacillus sp. SO9]